MAEACGAAGCALLGGETAEMPGMYHAGEYDVAGFIVGSAARNRLVLGEGIAPGDTVFGLPSSGLHTNGYSLVRRVFDLDGDPDKARERLGQYEPTLGRTLGEALTIPHRSYLGEIGPLLDLEERPVKGMAHITGGGLLENIPRALPPGCAVALDGGAWMVPPLFELIEHEGGISSAEMARVFNMGLGMVLIVSPEQVDLVESKLPECIQVGRVVAWDEGRSRVELRGAGGGV
jgi:phosphoribosylformylglycinamidine cyclo-ligase